MFDLFNSIPSAFDAAGWRFLGLTALGGLREGGSGLPNEGLLPGFVHINEGLLPGFVHINEA